jgi:tRNA 2-selenouridine synthase
VVCGPTGSGKTRLLGCLAEQGQQVLDLEALACHRGSLLGAEPSSPQPSQKAFESLLFDRLRALTPNRPVYVESESKKIGNLHLPDALMTQMRASDCIQIEMPTTARVCLLCEEYQHFLDNPEPLIQQLQKMAPLVGHDTVEGWLAQVTARDWPGLVGALLAVHYDPSYHRSIQRNFLKIAQATTVTIATAQRSDYEAAAASLSA